MRALAGIICGIFLSALVSVASAAETSSPRCASAEEVMATAIDQYGETAESILGSALTGAVMVLFVNRDTGTWTLLTQRGDQLCIVDMGSGLKAVKPKGQDA